VTYPRRNRCGVCRQEGHSRNQCPGTEGALIAPPESIDDSLARYAEPHPVYRHRCSGCDLEYDAVLARDFADGGWPPFHWHDPPPGTIKHPLCSGVGKDGILLEVP
jgi:hypothetical protein